MTKSLIIKLGAIGDVAMALPAVRALADNGTQIDWVCGNAATPLLQCFGWVKVISVDDSKLIHGSKVEKFLELLHFWKQLAGQQYDLVATLHYDKRYRLLSLPAFAERRLFLDSDVRNNALLAERHHTDEYARVLLSALGEREKGYTPQSIAPLRPDRLPATPIPRRSSTPRVVILPGGAKNTVRDDALRRWPLDSYVELSARLIKRGWEVILAGSDGDRWVESAFECLPIVNTVGCYTIPQLIALLDDSDVLITHDTGPLHLAGMTNVGVVSIFGPTNPWGRLPRRSESVAIWGGEGFACRPCYDGRNFAPCQFNGCMQQVTTEMVLRELDSLLERRANGVPSPPKIVLPEAFCR
jgi:heptosyltransferase-2